MKKILSLAAVASMALTSNAAKSPYQGMDYSNWGKLTLVGNQLSSAKTGEPVQLKGWSTFSLHYQGHCKGEGDWSLMKQYGANIVRLAMYIDDTWDGGSYLAKQDYFKDLIKQSIAETKALNMYCMVDWHILQQDNGGTGDPTKYQSQAQQFFAEISKYCADNGYDHVLYELCNEPTCGWSKIKGYAEAVIPEITKNQPDAIIVVGTDQWCQKIGEPVSNPIKADYKKNVMYSFHYYACSHYQYLGDFRGAQKSIPVFVSEWSAVKFDGDGPFCASNGNEMIAACEDIPQAPQLVSWCIWNWGTKDEASSFFAKGGCTPDNLSTFTDNSGYKYSDYVVEKMAGEIIEVEMPETGPWKTLNTIPSTTSSIWHWDYYDLGGEGIAYHDGNGGAWKKDKATQAVLDYNNTEAEIDVFSLAKKMQWTELPEWTGSSKECPWSKVENGKVVSFDQSISTGDNWKDMDGNSTYKSLNGGRMYSGTDGSERPDEGVDLSKAGMQGTDFAGAQYCNLGWVEPGEWISYHVKVTEPGYYKVSGIISAEYGQKAQGYGEISIVSENGNLLRYPNSIAIDEVTTFGFQKVTACADPAQKIGEPWNCWSVKEAENLGDEIWVAFGKAGVQQITVRFEEDCGGVGPLQFTKVAEMNPNDPATGVNTVNSDVVKFSIYPNPTSGEFSVVLAENAEATVEIVNIAGQVVASQNIEGSATIKKALAAGVYTVVVRSNGAVSTQKLVVK